MLKPAVRVKNSGIALEKKLSILLENGHNVWVLRHRKLSQYPVTIHGFDDFDVRMHKSPNSDEIRYVKDFRPQTYIAFEPNEEGVATAYCIETERNKRIIAKHFYSNQFEVVEIMTPAGVIPHIQAVAQLRQLVTDLGITKPKNDDQFSKHLNALKTGAADRKPLAIEPKPAVDTAPLPPPPAYKTLAECQKAAEDRIMELQEPMIKFLKQKHGDNWKKQGEYKAVIKVQIDAMAKDLAAASGLLEEVPPTITPAQAAKLPTTEPKTEDQDALVK